MKLSQLIQEQGLSLRGLARQAGIALSTVAAITGGKTRLPHPATQKKIAVTLGVKVSEIEEFRPIPRLQSPGVPLKGPAQRFEGPGGRIGAVLRLNQNFSMEKVERARNGSAWDTLEALTGVLDGPTDLSEEFDYYLYGSPKKRAGVTSKEAGDQKTKGTTASPLTPHPVKIRRNVRKPAQKQANVK